MQKFRNQLQIYPKALFYILGIAALVYAITYYAVLTNNPEVIRSHGEQSHREVAMHILETGSYPVSHRLPVYPVLIVGIYSIFGLHNDIPLIMLLAITSLSTIFLAYLIAEKLFNRQAGLWAAGLLALEMNLLHNSYSADFPDAFFTFFLTLAIYFTLKCFDTQVTLKNIAISALLLSLSALTKPIAYYIPILVFIPLSIYLYQNVHLRRTLRLSLAFLGIVSLIIGGWHVHNYTKSGYATFSPMKGFHFLFYTGAYILSEKENESFTAMKRKLQSQYKTDPEIRNMDPSRLSDEVYFFSPIRDKRLFKDAIDIIKSNPFTYLYVTTRGILKTMFWGCRDVALNFYNAQDRADIVAAPETGQRFATLRLSWDRGYYFLIVVMNATRLFSLLLWPTVLIGIIQHIWQKPIRIDLICLILIIGYLAFTAGAVGHIRYRLPYESLSVVFAGAFLAYLVSRVRQSITAKQQQINHDQNNTRLNASL